MEEEQVEYLSATEASRLVYARQMQLVEAFRQAGMPNDTVSMLAMTALGISNLLELHGWPLEMIHGLVDKIKEGCARQHGTTIDLGGN